MGWFPEAEMGKTMTVLPIFCSPSLLNIYSLALRSGTVPFVNNRRYRKARAKRSQHRFLSE